MSAEASREQLLDYIKKQKIKIKKLEIELNECKETTEEELGELRAQLQHIQASTPNKTAPAPDESSFTSGWTSFAGFVSNVVSEVGGAIPGEEGNAPARVVVGVTVEQLQNLIAEKDTEIDSLKQQISSVESLSADRLNEKSIEAECHMEVIGALKVELLKAQTQARRSSLDAFAAGTAAVGAALPPAPVEPATSINKWSQADLEAAVESAVAAAVESAVAGSSADLATLQGKLQDAEALATLTQTECDASKAKLVKFNAVVKAKMIEVDVLRGQLIALEATRSALEAAALEEQGTRATLESRCQELQAFSASLESQLNATKAEFEAAADGAKVDAEKASVAQQRNLDKLKDLKRQLNEKGTEISILQATLVSEQTRAKGFQEQLDASAAELERLRAAQGKVTHAAERLKKSKTATEEATVEHERIASELHLQLSQAQEEAALAREEREHQRRRVLELEGEMENMGNMHLEDREDMLQEQQRVLEEQKQRLENSQQAVREAIAARDQLVHVHKTESEAAEEEKNVLFMQSQNKERSHALAIQEVRDTMQAAIDAATAEKTAIIVAMQQENLLALEKAQAAAAATAAATAAEATTIEAEEVLKYKASLEKAVSKLKSQKAQLDTEHGKLQETLASLQARDVELATMQTAYAAHKEEADQHCRTHADLQAKHQTLEEEYRHAKLDHDAHVMSRKHMEEALHAAQQQTLQLQTQLELVQTQASAAQADACSSKHQEMQERLDIAVQRLDTCLQELSDLKQENADQRSQLAVLQAEKDQLSENMASMVSELERESIRRKEKKEVALTRESQLAELQSANEVLSKELALLASSTAVQSSHWQEEKTALQNQLNSALAGHEKVVMQAKKEADECLRQWEEQRHALNNSHMATQQEHGAEVTRLKREADKRVQEWEAKHNLLHAAYESTLAEQEDTIAKLKAELAQAQIHAQESNKSVPLLQAEKDALSKEIVSLQTAVEDGKTQCDVLRDKIQRLKVLLQRSKIVTQEKTSELARFLENESGKQARADKFEVLALVEFSSVGKHGPARDEGDISTAPPLVQWVLLYVDAPVHQPGAGLRWVEEAVARTWQDEGSVLLGDWPECLQLTHRRALKGAKVNLERELAVAKQSLKEQEEAFVAYKGRAQAALKRLGTEEAAARERAENAAIAKEQSEEEEVALLKEREVSLIARVTELEVALSEEKALAELHQADAKAQQDQEVQRATASLEEALFLAREEGAAALAAQVEATQKEQVDLQKQLNLFRLRIQELEHEVEEAVNVAVATAGVTTASATSTTDAICGTSPASFRMTGATSPEKESATSVSSQAQRTPAPMPSPAISELQVSDAVATILSAATGESTTEFLTSGTSDETNSSASNSYSMSPAQLSTSSDTLQQQFSQATPTPSKGQGKAFLYQRAEQELLGQLNELRGENSRAQSALRQSNEQRALADEQLIVIKNSLREVEASLAREKEFFAQAGGDRALNVEYLANILKKFLLTEPSNSSERARLAPVLCQILHFQPQDIKMVESLWKDKPYMGPLGFGFLRG